MIPNASKPLKELFWENAEKARMGEFWKDKLQTSVQTTHLSEEVCRLPYIVPEVLSYFPYPHLNKKSIN